MTHLHAPPEGRKATPEGSHLAPAGDSAQPLVDQSVLDRLTEELGDDQAYTEVFVTNFIQLLPSRIDHLRLALTTGDLEGAIDAVLSLKTSSQMVGADRLAGLAKALEADIRSETSRANPAAALPRQATTFLRPIKRCSTLTSYKLRSQCSLGSASYFHRSLQ